MKLISILKEWISEQSLQETFVYKVEHPELPQDQTYYFASNERVGARAKAQMIKSGTKLGRTLRALNPEDIKSVAAAVALQKLEQEFPSTVEANQWIADNGGASIERKQKISTSGKTGRTLDAAEIKQMLKLAKVPGALLRDAKGNLFIKGTAINQVKDSLRGIDVGAGVALSIKKFIDELVNFHIQLNVTDDKTKPQPFSTEKGRFYPLSLHPVRKPKSIGLGSAEEESDEDDPHADVVAKLAPKWKPRAADSKDAIELQNVPDTLSPNDQDVVKSLYKKK